jgi:uncharacterized cupin superfamily protein/RimJ/RimL family protein N-acetyltransferase
MLRPPYIVHWKDVLSADDSRYPNSEELHSIGSPLGKATGLHRIGVHHELLPPGRRTSFPHAEREEEELVYVIEGAPDVWLDGETHRLVPGDCVGFPAKTGIAHTFLNDTDEDVRLLVVGERIPGALVHYPLHPHVATADKRWHDVPPRGLGPHDGLPRALREGTPAPDREHVPTLETERLVLRKLTMAEVPMRIAMRSDPEHTRYLLAGRPSEEEARASMAFILRDMTLGRSKGFALVKKDGGEVIGQAGVVRIDAANRRASLAYELLRSAWGSGYAREAVARLVRFATDDLGLHRIQAEIDPRNTRSRAVVESLGFTYEGTLQGNSQFEGRFFDDAIYAYVRGTSVAGSSLAPNP